MFTTDVLLKTSKVVGTGREIETGDRKGFRYGVESRNLTSVPPTPFVCKGLLVFISLTLPDKKFVLSLCYKYKVNIKKSMILEIHI